MVEGKPTAKPKKLIGYNSNDIFVSGGRHSNAGICFLQTTALQIRLFVVPIMTSIFFVTELNSRCVKFGDYKTFVYEVKIYKHISQNYLTKNEPAVIARTSRKGIKFFILQPQKVKYDLPVNFMVQI